MLKSDFFSFFVTAMVIRPLFYVSHIPSTRVLYLHPPLPAPPAYCEWFLNRMPTARRKLVSCLMQTLEHGGSQEKIENLKNAMTVSTSGEVSR